MFGRRRPRRLGTSKKSCISKIIFKNRRSHQGKSCVENRVWKNTYKFGKFATSASNFAHEGFLLVTTPMRRVVAGELPKSRLEQLQRVCGFSCSPSGLLADTFLRQQINAIEVRRYDWMHSCLQDGTVTTEAGLLTGAFESIDIYPKDVEAYLKTGWCFPASTRPKKQDAVASIQRMPTSWARALEV